MHHDLFHGGRRRSTADETHVLIERRCEEVGDDPDHTRGVRDVGKVARMLQSGRVGNDVVPELAENGFGRYTVFGEWGAEPGEDFLRWILRKDDTLVEAAQVIDHPVDGVVTEGAKLVATKVGSAGHLGGGWSARINHERWIMMSGPLRRKRPSTGKNFMTTGTGAYEGLALPLEQSSAAPEVRRLYEHASIGIVATVVNSLILIGVLRNVVEPVPLFAWWACLMIVTVARFSQVEWFRRFVSAGTFDARRWGFYFVFGLGVAGSVWGGASIWLFPESEAHQTFLAFVLGGMVAGAAATFSVRMDAFLAYTVPALTPLAARFFFLGDEIHIAMGAMILLFGMLLTGTAHRVNRLLARTLSLEARLSEATRQSDGLNAQLTRSEHARSIAERALASHTEDNEERLRQYVGDMTETFVTLQEKSERRLRRRFERELDRARIDAAASFGTGMAYRLDNFLGKLSNHVREGLRDPDIFNTDAARRTLYGIEAVVDEEIDLVNELLAFASPMVNDDTPVDVGDLVASKVSEWRHRLPPRAGLWHSPGKESARVEGSSQALAHALDQLIANAVSAIDTERGTIEIRTRLVSRSEVDLAGAGAPSSRADSFVAIEVVDDGEGMDPQTARRVLEPFFSTQSRGRGLGLSIVRAIVLRHQGTLSIESHPLRGTAVRVFLPAARGQSRTL
jgi:signal transduction histidine kinase